MRGISNVSRGRPLASVVMARTSALLPVGYVAGPWVCCGVKVRDSGGGGGGEGAGGGPWEQARGAVAGRGASGGGGGRLRHPGAGAKPAAGEQGVAPVAGWP